MKRQVARILIVDDFLSFRDWVRCKLEKDLDFETVGEATDGLEAVQKALELRPDLILLDISLPLLNGIQVQREICRLIPSVKILFLTRCIDNDVIQYALSNGAKGCVSKSEAARELLPAMKAVFQGGTFVSGALQEDVNNRTAETPIGVPNFKVTVDDISVRQR